MSHACFLLHSIFLFLSVCYSLHQSRGKKKKNYISLGRVKTARVYERIIAWPGDYRSMLSRSALKWKSLCMKNSRCRLSFTWIMGTSGYSRQNHFTYIYIYVIYRIVGFQCNPDNESHCQNQLFCNYFETNTPSSYEDKFLKVALWRQDNGLDKITYEIPWYVQVLPASIFQLKFFILKKGMVANLLVHSFLLLWSQPQWSLCSPWTLGKTWIKEEVQRLPTAQALCTLFAHRCPKQFMPW